MRTVLFIMLLLTACADPRGTTVGIGPQGPPGEDGEAGQPGEQGEPGAPADPLGQAFRDNVYETGGTSDPIAGPHGGEHNALCHGGDTVISGRCVMDGSDLATVSWTAIGAVLAEDTGHSDIWRCRYEVDAPQGEETTISSFAICLVGGD